MRHAHLAGPEHLGLSDFFQKTLDSLLAHIAILEEDGTIIAVNSTWNAFASRNGMVEDLCGPGANYLHVCERATGACSEEANLVARGIRDVIAGRLPNFFLEYPCHSPTEPRWFSVRITRFEIEGEGKIVVSHDNITQRKIVELKLMEANALLERQATTDGLTGLSNRRCFDQTLEQEWKRHERMRAPLSLLLMDVDFFKRFNDTQGHLAGDDCLREVAQAIQISLPRTGDLVARYGGEEFAVILPGTDRTGALHVANLIFAGLRARGLPHPASEVGPNVTLSIGCGTTVPERDVPATVLIDQADRALYRAKAAGRGRVVPLLPGVTEPAPEIFRPQARSLDTFAVGGIVRDDGHGAIMRKI